MLIKDFGKLTGKLWEMDQNTENHPEKNSSLKNAGKHLIILSWLNNTFFKTTINIVMKQKVDLLAS